MGESPSGVQAEKNSTAVTWGRSNRGVEGPAGRRHIAGHRQHVHTPQLAPLVHIYAGVIAHVQAHTHTHTSL